jgi:hypothetical protein
MIEIAPEEYWKSLSKQNTKLYCFSLNIDGKIGWRLPTYREIEYDKTGKLLGACWAAEDADDIDSEFTWVYETIPVRDLKDN